MSKNVDFEVGTIVTDVFLDLLQEQLTGNMQNVRLAPSSLGSDRVVIAVSGDVVNDKRAALNIQGRYTYTDVSKDSSPADAGNGTKDIWAYTTANGVPQQPEFELAVSTSPPASSYIRKIGTAEKNGAQLSNVRLNNGTTADADQYNAFAFRSVMDLAGETMLTLRGQSNQLSPAGTEKSDPSLTPTKALSVGTSTDIATLLGTYTERFYIDTQGRMVWQDDTNGLDAVLQWNAGTGAGDDSSILVMNRILASYRDGESTTGAYDDPTLDTVATITRDNGLTAFAARALDADANDRIQISTTGVIEMGDGTLAPDTGFYRVKADSMAMLPGDKFYLDYLIDYTSDTGKLATNKEYVDTRDEFVESTSKRFAFFITP